MIVWAIALAVALPSAALFVTLWITYTQARSRVEEATRKRIREQRALEADREDRRRESRGPIGFRH